MALLSDKYPLVSFSKGDDLSLLRVILNVRSDTCAASRMVSTHCISCWDNLRHESYNQCGTYTFTIVSGTRGNPDIGPQSESRLRPFQALRGNFIVSDSARSSADQDQRCENCLCEIAGTSAQGMTMRKLSWLLLSFLSALFKITLKN